MGRTALIGINNRILFGVVLIVVSMGILLVFGSGYVIANVEKVLGFMGWQDRGEIQVDGYNLDREASSGQFRIQFHYVNSADTERTIYFQIKGSRLLGTIPSDAPETVITLQGGSQTSAKKFIYGDDSGEKISNIACEIKIVVKSDQKSQQQSASDVYDYSDTLDYRTITTKRIDLKPSEGPGDTRCR